MQLEIWKAAYGLNSCFKTNPKRKSPDAFCKMRDLCIQFSLNP
jgi:hypothetical protein